MGQHVGEPPTTGTSGVASVDASDVFVATFGVYDEGGGVRSLYLHPTAAVRLGAALLPLCLDGQLAVLTDQAPIPGANPLPHGGWLAPGTSMMQLQAPVEAALIGADVSPQVVSDAFPHSIMARPDLSLPESLDARFALAMNDPRHAVIFSRDPVVHRACLRALITDLAAATLDPALPLPNIPEAALDELLEPMEISSWWRLRTREHRRFRVLEVDAFPGGLEPAEQRSNWVADQRGGAWRTGWAW